MRAHVPNLKQATVALGALLAMTILLGGHSSALAQQAPTVSAMPSSAAPGEALRLQGSGWPPNVTLVAKMYQTSEVSGPSSPIGTAFRTDSTGTFLATGSVPRTLFGDGSRGNLNVVPGSYAIVVSGGPGPSATTSLVVRAPAQGALLWGEVFFDSNGSAQRDAGDTSAGGFAAVSVLGPTPSSPVRQVITDSRGRYMLLPIEAGTYGLNAQAQFGSATWADTATASVENGQATRVDLLLRPVVASFSPERYFAETGFAVDNDAFWDYFTHRAGIRTLGYPISRTFRFLGYPTQFFQRLILQEVPGQGAQPMNLLDPGLLPYSRINGSSFPPVMEEVKAATPKEGDPGYDIRVIDFVREYAPNQLNGKRVGFFDAFIGSVVSRDAFPEGDEHPELLPLLDLEIWGVPTSRPAPDPNNTDFVYLRFQRGIMHYQGQDTQGRPITEGILLGDWFKSLLTGQNLPADLEAQARADNSPYLRQYDRTKLSWVARPEQLPDTDLSFAFERQQ